jgi:serine/threonine protein kinase
VTSEKKLAEVAKLRELIQAEITILKQCRNPNVVRLITDFVHANHQFIVLEYCSGFELGDILLREKQLD